ncbi:unnamed protein product [Tilletia controversa]|nr:unnamed protein product [Tilletia controversa]
MASALRRTAAARTAPAFTRAASSSSSSPAEPPQPQPQPQPQPKPSFTTSASALAAQAAARPLPFLSSAPGYPIPPSVIPLSAPTPSPSPPSTTTTTTDTSKPSTKATARDAKIFAERKAILSEATKGYFHDFHALRAHGGKTWRAPTSLIRTERSRFWPDWSAKRLSDGVNLSTASVLKGRVSLVSVISSQASEGHVRSFTDLTRDTYDSHPTFQQITINVQLSALRAFLMRLVFNSIRDGVKGKKEQQGYFLCTSAPEVPAQVLQMELEAARRAASGAPPLDESNNNNNTVLGSLTGTNKRTPSTSSNSPGAEAYLRSALHLHNKHVGYVFLVDPGCRVRWAGCAFAEEAERDALRACTGVLLARH